MDDPNKRVCGICNHFKDYTCTDHWKGRKVSHFNTCAYHSEGADHLIKVKAGRTLTKEQIVGIRKSYREGVTMKELEKTYNKSYGCLYHHVRDLFEYVASRKEAAEINVILKGLNVPYM